MPTRIQRRRTRGWTAPLDAEGRRPVYVGRGSRWGNPWAVVETNSREWAVVWRDPGRSPGGASVYRCGSREAAQAWAVGLYREWLASRPELGEAARRELGGRDLMCWCALGLACHVDHLLTVANPDITYRCGGNHDDR